MSYDQNNNDRDLLSRLNALKKSHVELDSTSYRPDPNIPTSRIDPAPALALHSDLLSRFKSLSGTSATTADADGRDNGGSSSKRVKNEDDMTMEELLADLGPADHWNVEKSEHDNIEELLQSAKLALSQNPELEHVPDEQNENYDQTAKPTGRLLGLPAIDVAVFQAEPESDDDQPKVTKGEAVQAFDKEADDVLKRLMDEVRFEKDTGGAGDESGEGSDHEQSPGVNDSKTVASTLPGLDLPATPSKDPEPSIDASTGDEDLAARFASLSLPSVPTTIKSKPNAASGNKTAPGFTDEDIDAWCIICNDDATLSCIGCDGDLYCTNCWLEGHRGEDAGYEERKHKAVQYVKGGGKKKQKAGRVMMGA